MFETQSCIEILADDVKTTQLVLIIMLLAVSQKTHALFSVCSLRNDNT